MNKENVVLLHDGLLLSSTKQRIMKFADKLIEPENIILREVTQNKKDKHDMYSLISGYWIKANDNQSVYFLVHKVLDLSSNIT